MRCVKIRHQFPSPESVMGGAAYVERRKSDVSFTRLCALLTRFLPRIEVLEVVFEGALPTGSIVPSLVGNPNAADGEQLRRVAWFGPLKQFKGLRWLKEVSVVLPRLDRNKLLSVFFSRHRGWTLPGVGTLSNRQIMDVGRNWVAWAEVLSESYARAAERMILTKDEMGIWDGHQKLLEGFRQWNLDPMGGYEVYLPLPSEGVAVEVEAVE